MSSGLQQNANRFCGYTQRMDCRWRREGRERSGAFDAYLTDRPKAMRKGTSGRCYALPRWSFCPARHQTKVQAGTSTVRGNLANGPAGLVAARAAYTAGRAGLGAATLGGPSRRSDGYDYHANYNVVVSHVKIYGRAHCIRAMRNASPRRRAVVPVLQI